MNETQKEEFNSVIEAIKNNLQKIMVNEFHLPIFVQVRLLAEIDMTVEKLINELVEAENEKGRSLGDDLKEE